jgi:flagellar FliL protein
MATTDITAAAEEKEEAQQAPRRSGGRKLIFAVAIVILLGGAGAAVFLLNPAFLDKLTGAHAATAEPAKKAAAIKAPPLYTELGDAFVVNFGDGAHVRYLQVKIEAMTRDPEMQNAIRTHLPRIRNNLVFLLSAVDYPTISTVEGKEKLRDEALKQVQDVLKDETGKTGIEALYFTSFVIQ